LLFFQQLNTEKQNEAGCGRVHHPPETGRWLRALWLIFLIGFSTYAAADTPGASLRIGGSGTDLGTMRQLADGFLESRNDLDVEIPQSMGSGGAVRAVAAGALDIGLLSRPPGSQERAADLSFIHYARTPLVFAASERVTQDAISSSQLIEAYRGNHGSWDDGSLIKVILRPRNDSDTRLLRKNLPWITAPLDAALERRGIPIATTDQETANLVATVSGAIGTTTLALIYSEQKPLKALTLDSIEPTLEAVRNGSYPMVKDLYLAVRVPAKPEVRDFVDFMVSPQGRLILERTGHVVVTTGDAIRD